MNKPPTLTWEELREAIIEYNKRVPEGEKITSLTTYNKFYKKIPGAPSNPYETYSDFKERGGLSALLSKLPKPVTLTWEELREAIIEYNKRAPEGERITSRPTYNKFYKKIPGAPSDPYVTYSDFKERGGFSGSFEQASKTSDSYMEGVKRGNYRV